MNRSKLFILALAALACVAATVNIGRTSRIRVAVQLRLVTPGDAFTNSTATLEWSAVEGATGYQVYTGVAPGVYTNVVDVTTNLTAELDVLENVTNYYATTAYLDHDEVTRTESDYSNEISLIRQLE